MKSYWLFIAFFCSDLRAQTSQENEFVAAINSGNTGQVERLFKANPELINIRTGNHSYTPLYLAVMRGDVEMVRTLSKLAPKSIIGVGSRNNMPPASLAASLGRDDMLRVMWDERDKNTFSFYYNDDITHQRSLLHWVSQRPMDPNLLFEIYKEADKTFALTYTDRHGKTFYDYLGAQEFEAIPKKLAQEMLVDEKLVSRGKAFSYWPLDRKDIPQDGPWTWNDRRLIAIAKVAPHLLKDLKDSLDKTALWWAVENKKDPKLIEALIKQDPEQVQSFQGLLSLAARTGQLETTRLIVKYDPSAPYYRGKDNYLAVHDAAREGKRATTLELLKLAPGNLDEKTAQGLSLLHLAAINGDENFINSLAQMSPSLASSTDMWTRLPLHLAASYGNIQATQALAKIYPLGLWYRDGDRNTPLDSAIRNKRANAALALVEIEPKLLAPPNELSPLFSCVEYLELSDCYKLAKLNPAALKSRNKDSVTVLHKAAKKDSPAALSEMANLDLSNLLLVNDKGNTPLHSAIEVDEPIDTSITKSLGTENAQTLGALEPKALLHKNKLGRNPLMIAAVQNNLPMVLMLAKLEPKALLEGDNDGNSALHLATINGSPELVEALAKLEPKLLLTLNKGGQSPLHAAASLGKTETLKLLANLEPRAATIRDGAQCLPIHYAAKSIENTGTAAALLAKLKPETLLEVDAKGCTPLHIAAKMPDNGRIAALIKLDPSALSKRDHEGKTPVENALRIEKDRKTNLTPGTTSSILGWNKVLNPDRKVPSADTPPHYALAYESEPDSDPHFPNAVTEKKSQDFIDFLNRFELSRLKNTLLLTLSNCSATLRFGQHVIPVDRALLGNPDKSESKSAVVEWESLPLPKRLEKISALFELDPLRTNDLESKLLELESSRDFERIRNRFILLSAKKSFQEDSKTICAELSSRARSEIESHLGRLWAEAKEKNPDQAALPQLAKILSVSEGELEPYTHTAKFLDEDLVGEKRDALVPVVSHCVDCHNPQAKDVDYPLSFKKADLDRAPDSPKSKEKTLRAETLRRLDLPASDPLRMPKGGDHELSQEQTKALKEFLQQEAPALRSKD